MTTNARSPKPNAAPAPPQTAPAPCPDEAEAAARRLGFTVLQGAMDKPHGLREAFLIDADGYLWVADVPLAG